MKAFDLILDCGSCKCQNCDCCSDTCGCGDDKCKTAQHHGQ